MKGSMIKRRGLKFLTWLGIAVGLVMAACPITAAQDDDNDLENIEVLTTLEQRMLKKISVNFRDTPIDDVIRIMAEQADVDIIKNPKVIGEVTATLTDVPLEEALNNILIAHGYGYVADKNMIRIAPIGEITEREEALINKIFRITYADVIEVEKALKKFLSNRGSLSSNPGTSHIIVTDTQSKMKAMETFVNEIDRITPQVLVEVRIYDITSTDRFDLGVDWQLGRRTNYGTGGAGTLGSATSSAMSYTKKDGSTGYIETRRDPYITGGFSGVLNNTTDTSALIRFGILNASINIDAIIRAEQENISAKLLANPRILVLDNEVANFKIVREIPYEEETQTEQGGLMTSTEFKEVGVELTVKPHVARDGIIRLHIAPEFSVQVGSTSPPTVDTRKVDTIALVKDGQTVVIGGLRKRDASKQTNKIPFLGDIPLLGGLFRFEGEETVTNELLIFITPRIVEQAVLSEAESKRFEVTEFSGPEPAITRVEKPDK